MIVDFTLSFTGSQLIVSVLPTVHLLSPDLHNLHLMIPLQADKGQRVALYDCICGHIVTLCGCESGLKVIWLLYVYPIQFLL
jgi:hypothetical protein